MISWNFVAVKDQVQLLVSTNWSPRGWVGDALNLWATTFNWKAVAQVAKWRQLIRGGNGTHCNHSQTGKGFQIIIAYFVSTERVGLCRWVQLDCDNSLTTRLWQPLDSSGCRLLVSRLHSSIKNKAAECLRHFAQVKPHPTHSVLVLFYHRLDSVNLLWRVQLTVSGFQTWFI